MSKIDSECSPQELSLKSFFVGPQAENSDVLYNEIQLVLDTWIEWRKNYYPKDGLAITPEDKNNPEFQAKIKVMRDHTVLLMEKFSKEIPKFSPRYLGHMFSEISMPAIIGHLIALLHNPNNVSKESSWVGVDIEKKAIQALSQMVGYSEKSIGHFTSGGTIANFEAVSRAKNRRINHLVSNCDLSIGFNDACYLLGTKTLAQKNDLGEIELYKLMKHKYGVEFEGFVIIVPDSKHYSWVKAASIFGLGAKNLIKVNLNRYGQMCHNDLNKKIDQCLLQKKPILCITSIFGSTELGTIDPIEKINELLLNYKNTYGYNFWHHVDAAYGGFFACLKESNFFETKIQEAIDALQNTTSITIDPHKLGYVPYAAGAFICNNPLDYYGAEFAAPYVNFELNKDPGPYTIEGSRTATGAVALYMTSECIGLNKNGYGKILERTINASEQFCKESKEAQLPLLFTETVGTNIVCFALGKSGDTLSEVNKKTKKLLGRILKTESNPNEDIFFVSKTNISENYKFLIDTFCKQNNIKNDCGALDLLRLTIMNPFVNSINSKTNYISDFVSYIKNNI